MGGARFFGVVRKQVAWAGGKEKAGTWPLAKREMALIEGVEGEL